jgi:hypothetical protein
MFASISGASASNFSVISDAFESSAESTGVSASVTDASAGTVALSAEETALSPDPTCISENKLIRWLGVIGSVEQGIQVKTFAANTN